MAKRYIIGGAVLLVLAVSVLCGLVFKRAMSRPTGRVSTIRHKMNDAFVLSERDQEELVRRAAAGDGDAAFALSEYHGFVTGNLAQYEHWLLRAATLGNVIAQYNYGHDLLDAGRFKEARLFLERANSGARRSGDRYTQKLATGELERLATLERMSPTPTPLSR